ncbi:MAG: helix-turn-helix transcriptional regulator [Planctomycetes bacterium]|nr:helix-turn-helix transcriptional regulator [Planctomycetota bacterium]
MQNGSEVEAAVRDRLLEVARRYPQAEIARRTGWPTSSVSRYLDGNRIPVSFVAKVAHEFGANPTWLLSGEGAPWLADAATEESSLGKGLLELVQSMEQISRLKLGALAGRSHARALRDLNDALASYERVRERLAGQSRETYARILKEWDSAQAVRDMPSMLRLAKAADQVARLCPDPELNRRHEFTRTAQEAVLGNVERALSLRRRSLLLSIAESGELDARALHEAFGVVITLNDLGRTQEAVRFAEAMLKLAPNARSMRGYAACEGTYGWMLIQSGRVSRGIAVCARAMASPMPDWLADNMRMALATGMFLAGSASLQGAAAMQRPAAFNYARVLFLSSWCMDQAELAGVMKAYEKQTRKGGAVPAVRIARAQLLALQGRHDAALELWNEAENDRQAREKHAVGLDFVLHTMRTQLLRMAGRQGPAVRALQQAEAARKAVAPGVMLEINWQRVHWRNVRALSKDRKQLARVEKFARWCRRNGIHFAA